MKNKIIPFLLTVTLLFFYSCSGEKLPEYKDPEAFKNNASETFSSDFESENLDNWTISGTQNGTGTADIVSGDSSDRVHLGQKDSGEITIENLINYNPNLLISFEMEAHATSQASSESEFYAKSGAIFIFLNNTNDILGTVEYIRRTSSYPLTPSPTSALIEIGDDENNVYNLTINDISSNIGIDNSSISFVKVIFEAKTSGDDMYADVWIDNFIAGPVPNSPTGVGATLGNSKVIISWDEVNGADSYIIYWSETADVTKISGTRIYENVTNPYTHTGLTNETTYYYIVTAKNNIGESIESEETNAIPTAPPDPPSEVTATAGDREIIISWNEVNVVDSYIIYWSETTGVTKSTGTRISENVTNPYTHTGLANGSTYYYIVTAVDSIGESIESEETSVLLPPDPPTNVIAMPGNEEVTIKWENVNGADSYIIYWSETENVTKSTGTKISENVTNPYIHTNLINETTYYYIVTAATTSGVESDKSEEVNATPDTLPIQPTNISVIASASDEVTISWDNIEGMDSYNIYWSEETGVTKTTDTKITSAANPYTHSELTIGNTYYYIITSVANSIEGNTSEEAAFSLTPPKPPTNVKAFSGDTIVAITWDDVTETISYNIYWSETPGPTKSTGTKISNVKSPTTVSDLTNGTKYFYVVTAVNSVGESLDSNIVSATPYTVFYSFDFENGWGTYSADNGVWEIGTPTAGPIACSANTQCAATILNGNYPANTDSRLISPSIVLPTVTGGEEVHLRFRHWFSYDKGDAGYVHIRTFDDVADLWSDWAAIGNSFVNDSGGWSSHDVELTPFAGKTVKIAFYHTADDYWGQPNDDESFGWAVNDIKIIHKISEFTGTFDFENGLGEWGSDRGVWQVGKPTAGPEGCYAGTQCAATILNGNYPANTDSSLISPSFVLPAVTGREEVHLRFRHWFSYDKGDAGYVQIKTFDDVTDLWSDWAAIGNSFVNDSGDWATGDVELTPFAGKIVKIAFYHTADDYWGQPNDDESFGWAVNDMKVIHKIPEFTGTFDFENGLGDWATDSGVWQVGTPTAGPEGCYAGIQCAATILNGNYPANTDSRLISPSFDLPDVVGAVDVHLRFWHWFSYSGTGYVQIKTLDNTAGIWSDWVSVGNGIVGDSGAWSLKDVNLTAYAGQTVRIAFYHTAGTPNKGWYVDNISIEMF